MVLMGAEGRLLRALMSTDSVIDVVSEGDSWVAFGLIYVHAFLDGSINPAGRGEIQRESVCYLTPVEPECGHMEADAVERGL